MHHGSRRYGPNNFPLLNTNERIAQKVPGTHAIFRDPLDQNTAFEIEVRGNETKSLFTGKFKYTRPTLGARTRIAATLARLNGDVENLNNYEVEKLNTCLAYLRHTIVDCPEWWRDSLFGMELYDSNVIEEVYNKCIEFEEKWKTKIHSEKVSDVMEKKEDAIEGFDAASQG